MMTADRYKSPSTGTAISAILAFRRQELKPNIVLIMFVRLFK